MTFRSGLSTRRALAFAGLALRQRRAGHLYRGAAAFSGPDAGWCGNAVAHGRARRGEVAGGRCGYPLADLPRQGAEIRPLQADYVRALLRTMRLAGQTELDKDALRAAVKEFRDKRLKIGDAALETFITTLEQISPKGRRQIVGGFRDR